MTYAYVHTPRYDSGVREWMTDPRAMATLHETLSELAKQPFNNPILQTHRMKGRSDRKLFITDVDGRKGWRLIWNLIDRTIVLLLFGEHDKVERQAERIDYEVDDVSGAVRLIEYVTREVDVDADQAHEPRVQYEPGQLFMAWTDTELGEFGFTAAQVHHLRRLDGLDDLDGIEAELGDEAYDRALKLAVYHSPEGAPIEERVDRSAAEAVVAEAPTVKEEKELSERIISSRSRKDFSVVPADQLADVLSKPIEDWMVFLHPDQLKLTQRPYSGPGRVRGAAGTGKTVVALHRAKHLARTYPDSRILFTTYVNNLPTVFETLFKRFAADEADRVEFRNVHSWAHRFLSSHGLRPRIDPAKSNGAFASAWRSMPSGASIGEGQRGYFQEEIEWVIKGRGLTDRGQYLALARTGRGTPLRPVRREEVWALYQRYQTNLQRAGVEDFSDLLLNALRLVEKGAADGMYRAVLIDEAQDLTEVGLKLLHRLAGSDQRDGLFMVGDGQQSVYPGGFSLSSVGVDVRGRSSLLKTNYRNTRQILATAAQIVEGATFDDGDDHFEEGKRTVAVIRDGDRPALSGFDTLDDHDEALVLAISEVTDRPDVSPGDVAVLFPTNKLVREYDARISDLGLQTQKLEKYEGTPNDAVKLGTFQRAKGLEFKYVFLPRLEPESLGETRRHNEDEDAHTERLALLRRQLYVAMTRARDGVWGGWVATRPDVLGESVPMPTEGDEP